MFISTPKKRFIFVFFFILIFSIINVFLFFSIYLSNNINIFFAVHPFNICYKYPNGWKLIKNSYIIISFFYYLILANVLYSNLFRKNPKSSSQKNVFTLDPYFNLKIGLDSSNNNVFLPLKGLFQNILITGTIGTGKTSSAMYPFTEQLISFKSNDDTEKISMLILDVKGNYHSQVKKYCNKYKRNSDLITIDLKNEIKYNPLDKPDLKPIVLANRLKTILTLFSQNNGESFWLDKVEQILTECIKLCRLYNDNYVTFLEIHNLITLPNYYSEKINILRNNFISGKFSKLDCYNLLSSLNFFEKEYSKLDDRTLAILKSEITRITGPFISDIDILNTFSPNKDEITFKGFKEVLNSGKIVVLNMNISEYKNLSKIIAAYLKLDFQTEVMINLANNENNRISAFISDEYHEYVTSTDADFFAQSREAKCINIIATQSYTSLLNTLNNKYTVTAITQNLVNKIWFRSDDIFTIESAQKQFGKKDRTHISHTFSENAKQTNYNFITHSLNSRDSNISESINTSTQFDYIYDSNFFTKTLKTFSSLCFLTDGNKITYTGLINMLPYFK